MRLTESACRVAVVGDVLVRRQEQHHFTFLVLDRHDVQQTPERTTFHSKVHVTTVKRSSSSSIFNDGCQIFAGVRWWGGVKWECGRWKWRFSLLPFTVFRAFYIHGHTTAFTWCGCRWPWRYFKVIRLCHIKFLINGVWHGKSYCRLY